MRTEVREVPFDPECTAVSSYGKRVAALLAPSTRAWAEVCSGLAPDKPRKKPRRVPMLARFAVMLCGFVAIVTALTALMESPHPIGRTLRREAARVEKCAVAAFVIASADVAALRKR
jgi:hypothetical protein